MPPVPLPEGMGMVVLPLELPELSGVVLLPPELAGRSELPAVPRVSGLLALPDGVLEG